MLFKPGRYVKVRHRQSGAAAQASILKAIESELSLLLLADIKLYPGDEVELEIYRHEEALYFCQASVIEAAGNRVNVLQEEPGLCRPQRRRSERIPANLKIEFSLLSNNSAASCHEGLLRDVSRHGALIYVKEPLALGQKILLTLEFDLNRGEKAVATSVQARTIRQHSSSIEADLHFQYSYGLEFEKPLGVT